MNPSQANSRENQRQAIDADIKSLEESIRALRHRRNALAPVSSLPIEVTTAIFSFLRVPVASSLLPLGEKPDHLAWLRVAHVCHHWREIALNQPLFWSHVDFTTFSLAGAAEILARAKTAPLYLEARVPTSHWDDSRFSAFQNELHAHAPQICHLAIGAGYFGLRKTLEGLTSRAPTLEYLSLSCEEYPQKPQVFVPTTLFNGNTPRLSHLELQNCDINWNSPLLKGLRYLDIRTPSAGTRPSLPVWLNALEEMPQLETLSLHGASPIVPYRRVALPFDVERTISLPSLAQLDISTSAGDCRLALAHLDLPALTRLCLTVRSFSLGDLQDILPHVARNSHGPQDAQPLQSVVVRSNRTCIDILACTLPDIDVKLPNPLPNPIADLDAIPSARLAFSVTNESWSSDTLTVAFDAVMAALPLDSLVSLTALSLMSPFTKQCWLQHAPRWPLLQHVRLGSSAASGFREMLLEDNGGRESPLLPSLTKLVLFNTGFSARRTLRLCDALMRRVEHGVPLETLHLRTCIATSRAVELLSEIVVNVLGPEVAFESAFSVWYTPARGLFIQDHDSGLEDYDEDDTGSDDEVLEVSLTDEDEVLEVSITDEDGDGYDEDEADYW
jgi:hypothetical protein